jgi:hypothetical protein
LSIGRFNLSGLAQLFQNCRELRLQPRALEFAVKADRRFHGGIRPKFGETILVMFAASSNAADVTSDADATSLAGVVSDAVPFGRDVAVPLEGLLRPSMIVCNAATIAGTGSR